MTTQQLESRLRGAFLEANDIAKAELNFGMPVLLQMTARHGPTDTARQILTNPTSMYTTLLLRNRLDLSVEAIVLRPEFRPLFTEDEIRVAGNRLREANYSFSEAEEDDDVARGQIARRSREAWAEENPYG